MIPGPNHRSGQTENGPVPAQGPNRDRAVFRGVSRRTVRERTMSRVCAERRYEMTHVVAALIRDGDRFMICQRPEYKTRGLLWEFVGGKVEPGETGPEALIRECREELDVTVDVGDVYAELVHEYPDMTILLTLYNAVISKGEPRALEHRDIRFILPSEIGAYEFCPADEEILSMLARGEQTVLS